MSRTAREGAWGLFPTAGLYLVLRFTDHDHAWLAIGCYHLFCFAIPRLHGLTLTAAGLDRTFGWRKMLRWTAVALSMAVVIRLAGAQVMQASGVSAATLVRFLSHLPWGPFAIYSLTVNPLLEEYFWRGFILPRTGIILGGALFGLMHGAALAAVLPPMEAALLSLPTFAAGWAWGWLRRRTGSLWPCVLTHLGADAGILWFIQSVRGGW